MHQPFSLPILKGLNSLASREYLFGKENKPANKAVISKQDAKPWQFTSPLVRAPPHCWLAAASELEVLSVMSALSMGQPADVAIANKLKERVCSMLQCSAKEVDVRVRATVRALTSDESGSDAASSKKQDTKTKKPVEVCCFRPRDVEQLGYDAYSTRKISRAASAADQRRGSARLVGALASRMEAERAAKDKINSRAYMVGVREKRALLTWVRDMYAFVSKK